MWYFQPLVSFSRLKTRWKFTFSPLEITLGENPNRFCTQKKIKEIGVYIYLGGLINKCGQKIYDTAFLFLSIRILMKRSLVTHKMKSQRRCNLSALLVVLVNTSKSKAFFLYLIFLFDKVVFTTLPNLMHVCICIAILEFIFESPYCLLQAWRPITIWNSNQKYYWLSVWRKI